MTRWVLAVLTCLAMVFLGGCGGSGVSDGPTPPPPDGGGTAPLQVGPLLVRPAAAAGFVAQEIPNPNGAISLIALYGSRITYLASQALLDRIVFSRGSGWDHDICVANLDGSGVVKLIDNQHFDDAPQWSPDGSLIAFHRSPSGSDSEIVRANANGSGAQALTVNDNGDYNPTWSPNGDEIAWEHRPAGQQGEIFSMYADGSGKTNLTNAASLEDQPDWSRNAGNPIILFRTTRDGNPEIYRMGPDGQTPTRLTNTSGNSGFPAASPTGYELVFDETAGGGVDLWATTSGGLSTPRHLVSNPGSQSSAAWSSDGRFVCYTSDADGDKELMLREMAEPFRIYQLTNNGTDDLSPHLGSPMLQVDRVIIGPAGSDWGGYNPIWANSDAGIAAYAADGYRNFVRVGVPAAQLPGMSVTPLAATTTVVGGGPVGVVVEAGDIVNLREDGGRGRTPVLWQLDPLNATAVLLYFDGDTGKLLAVMVLRDQNYPAAAATGIALSQRPDGDAVVAEGAFAAVFDATGARIADAANAVRLAGGEVGVLR